MTSAQGGVKENMFHPKSNGKKTPIADLTKGIVTYNLQSGETLVCTSSLRNNFGIYKHLYVHFIVIIVVCKHVYYIFESCIYICISMDLRVLNVYSQTWIMINNTLSRRLVHFRDTWRRFPPAEKKGNPQNCRGAWMVGKCLANLYADKYKCIYILYTYNIYIQHIYNMYI